MLVDRIAEIASTENAAQRLALVENRYVHCLMWHETEGRCCRDGELCMEHDLCKTPDPVEDDDDRDEGMRLTTLIVIVLVSGMAWGVAFHAWVWPYIVSGA